MKKTLSVILAVLFVSCTSSFHSVDERNDELIGIWLYSDNENEMVEYVKSKKFKEAEVGIEFKKNGKLTRRQNVGWCGTPPITYGNYDGSWKFTSDSTLTIQYDYWEGKAEQDWRILELNSEKLKIEVIEYRRVEK